jgi:hypothetical protein
LEDVLGSASSDSSYDPEEADNDSDAVWDEEDPSASVSRQKSRRQQDLADQLAESGVSRSFAHGFLRNVYAASGSRKVYPLFKYDVTPKFPAAHEHSKRECLSLARIIDALCDNDLEGAKELACRRLGGVQTAAETGSWQMCEHLESEAEQRTFVPAAFMAAALKRVNRLNAIKKTVAEGGKAGPSSYSGRSGIPAAGQKSSYKGRGKDAPSDPSSTGASLPRKSGSSSNKK